MGEYRLSAEQRPDEILSRIAEGRVETYPVVIPEGLTARKIGERLEAAGLVSAAEFRPFVENPASAAKLGVEGSSLEGYLFPETYRLPHGLAPAEVAKVMVDQFLGVWREIAPRAHEQGLSMHDVVILASIVESP